MALPLYRVVCCARSLRCGQWEAGTGDRSADPHRHLFLRLPVVRRHARLILFAIPLALWGAWGQQLAWSVFHHLDYNDFGRFYYAVVNWRTGGSLYGPTVA